MTNIVNNDEVVICKRCMKQEFYNKMKWLSGACICRDCYLNDYEKIHGKGSYKWDDLNGDRPTMNE